MDYIFDETLISTIINSESIETTTLEDKVEELQDIFKYFRRIDKNELFLKKRSISDVFICLKDISENDLVKILVALSIERDDFKNCYGWERTPDGFEYRRNFRFLEGTNTLVYDTHQIKKENGIFVSDGTKITEDFMREKSCELKAIEEADEIRERLNKTYEKEINEELNSIDNKRLLHTLETIGNNKRPHELTSTLSYFYNYEGIGKYLLLKWLNIVSDNSLFDYNENMMDEFRKDTIEMEELMDLQHLIFNNRSSSNYEKNGFDINLANELAKFSPKGIIFKNLYINKYKRKPRTI